MKKNHELISNELLAEYIDGKTDYYDTLVAEKAMKDSGSIEEVVSIVEDLRDFADYLGVPELKREVIERVNPIEGNEPHIK